MTRLETYVEKTADEVESYWQQQAEQELQRIARAAPAGTAAEQAAALDDEGELEEFDYEDLDGDRYPDY